MVVKCSKIEINFTDYDKNVILQKISKNKVNKENQRLINEQKISATPSHKMHDSLESFGTFS